MIRSRSRVLLAIVCSTWLPAPACGGDAPSVAADSSRGEALQGLPLAADTPMPGDTAIAASRDTARPAPPAAATGGPSAPGVRGIPAADAPRTAPPDRAAAPAVIAGAEAPPPTPAPDSATIAPRIVAPPDAAAEAREVERTAPRPFSVGERLTYEVRFGRINVGTATMHVVGIEEVRGVPAYHTRFEVRGGNRLYRVQDRYESWFDTRSLASLRYIQDIDEGNYERRSVFEIYPEQQRFVEHGKEARPSVQHPLDEGSFLYWLRTIPLEVGRTYTFDRYFRPDRNPVRIEVLRRERVQVPAGTFDAIVVRPVIQTRGIFSEGGRAEIWFADDSTRRMLQMKSRLSFGSLNLYLK